MWNSIKPYVAPLFGLITAIVYGMFRKRGDEIAELQTQVNVTKAQTDLTNLEKESQNANQQAQAASNDYDALKRLNPELSDKLGIAANQSDTKGN